MASVLPKILEKLEKIPLTGIFALAVLLRVLAFWALGDRLFPDSTVYVQSGIDFFEKGFISSDFYMPLYPIITFLMGGRTGGIYFDILVSSALVFLAARLSFVLFKDQLSSKLAALTVAFYPYFIFYASTLLTESLFITLMAASFYFFYTMRLFRGLLFWMLNLLVKPVGELFTLPLLLAFGWVQKWPLKKFVLVLASSVILYIGFLGPWWYHNSKKYGEFVRLTLADGVVLYSGNNPMNKSGGGIMNPDGTGDVNLTTFDSIENPVRRNEAMKKAAFDYIKEDPLRFIEMAGVKFIRFWRLWPYAQDYGGVKYIIISLLSYGVLLGLCLWRLIVSTKHDWQLLAPILLFVTYLTAIHIVTIGSIRYRLPLELFVILLGVDQICRLLRAKFKRSIVS